MKPRIRAKKGPLAQLLAFATGLGPLLLASVGHGAPAEAGKPLVIFSGNGVAGGTGVHLPSLLVTKRGIVVAVCQLRTKSPGDWGHEMDLLSRRSADGGVTWEAVQPVFADPATNAVNGGLVEDVGSGSLLLPFAKVPTSVRTQGDWVKYFAQRGGGIWTTISKDDGRSWSPPAESKPAGPPGWIAWPANSSHGVQLADGRIVIGGFAHHLIPGSETYRALALSSCLLLSDDHGQNWQIGAITPFYGTDEIALALGGDGSIVASVRINNRAPHDLVRLVARSRDRGQSFSECWLQDHLSISNCHAGMIQWDDSSRGAPRHLLAHSGPQGGGDYGVHFDRSRLAIRLSYDDGRSWPVARLLSGPAINTEYSDLAVAADGTILCLYGVDTAKITSHIELVRLSLDNLELDYSPLK